MRNFFFILFLVCIKGNTNAQIIGKVVDQDQNPLASVNIYLEEDLKGTTTNSEGEFILDIKDPGNYKIIFQHLGFSPLSKEVQVAQFPYKLQVQLTPEENSLEEVVIDAAENPANRIIKQAIEHRKSNKNKIKQYTADFYSKGNWTVENMPSKILGQQVDEENRFGLDSTGSGMIYLSETRSKINYRAPKDFHEQIIASKVSGDDNGFSLNSAFDAEFSFYDNTIGLNAELISPLSNSAFNYYKYKLISVNYDEYGHLINKIEVIPKRSADRVFFGIIYIVEDSWEIYGINLKTTGTSAQIPPVEELVFQQSFAYFKEEDFWVKLSQQVSFSFKLLGISGKGSFLAVYDDYDFYPEFDRKTFSKEIMGWDQDANKKEETYWEKIRPVALTQDELVDYRVKDSLYRIRESKAFKDSIDRKNNKFAISDILTGYTYRNSYRNMEFKSGSPLMNTHFNTVQGWNISLDPSFTKREKETQTYWQVFSDLNYGFSDHRFRASGGIERKFNNFSKPILTLQGGNKIEEINRREPINLRINDVANLFFERNYLKLYDKKFIEAKYAQELFNGFRISGKLGYEKRTPLLNSTEQVIRSDRNGGYTSNNPLEPENFQSVPFDSHTMMRFSVLGKLAIGQEYYTYPDGKYSMPRTDYPILFLSYRTGFASDIKAYNYHLLNFIISHNINLKRTGRLAYGIGAGKFFKGENIALVDYEHFSGNQFRVRATHHLNRFELLPYYALSSNDQYAQFHLEHNFKGFLLGKIPYINTLNFNTVVGTHVLWTGGNKPYQEVSLGLDNLGFGAFRFFRVDYVHSFHEGKDKGGFIFGLKFLNLL